jgi:predicted ATPase/DNA-binding CsgD family transcriptional regulator
VDDSVNGAGTETALPAEIAAIVGRRQELRQLGEMLVETRLLTLTGVGGVGKSRLAHALATRLGERSVGRAWLVELASVRDPNLVASAVARSVGAEKNGRESLEESIARFIGGMRALLLLDDCEHVVETVAELAHTLLQRCPRLRVLTTSRQALGLEGEATFTVPPLALPRPDEQVHSPQYALAFEAVQMFAARAAAAEPSFVLTENNVEDVIEICRRLDGIPLGIELAAVRVRTLALGDLRDRLADQLSLSTLSGRSALARHRTLAATIDWSHDLLHPEERLLLHRLSVFSGGFTAEGARSVCADEALARDTIVETLSALVDQSLVWLDRDAPSDRYRLLEPVRLYALEKLRASGSEQAIREAHLRWCIEWTARLGQWHGGAGAREAREVADERGNLFAALDFSLADPRFTEIGFELLDQIARTWLNGKWARELIYYGDSFLATDSGSLPMRARILYATGRARWRVGDFEPARRKFEECRDIAGRNDDYVFEQGLARLGLGFAALWAGETEDAASNLALALELIDPVAEPVMNLEAALWLACTKMQDEDSRPEARLLIESSLEIADTSLRGLAYWLLGHLSLRESRLEAAEAGFRSSLGARFEIGHRIGAAYALQGLAFTASAATNGVRAAQLMGAAEGLSGGAGHRLVEPPGLTRNGWETALRRELGNARFDAAYAAGRALPFAEAAHLGLGEGSLHSAPTPRTRELLTRRESEIARLIATGATNRKIAAKLAISDQTVKFHVHNILAKLSFESRAQIVAWQTRRQAN